MQAPLHGKCFLFYPSKNPVEGLHWIQPQCADAYDKLPSMVWSQPIIWSLETMFDDLHIEKLNVKFCKYLLGVNKKASNLAVRGELGRYPFLIDVVLSMVKYWVRLNDTKNKITDNLLLETIKENKAMADKNQPCWLTCLKTILFEIGMPNIYLHPAKCTRKTIKDLQIKLKSRYVQKWHQEVSSIKLDKSTNQDSNKL